MESRSHMALMSPVMTKLVSLGVVAARRTVVSRVLGSVLVKTHAKRLLFCWTSLAAMDLICASIEEETKRRAAAVGRRLTQDVAVV